ncbi:hypothetical protein BEWA_049280 [Theileria equi strain WA]|uniref:Signal peptide containing protein n=1 Tax=Theileria equi strain WA TaxID=1537102 RepID=L1LAV6_THEEQ|nr:hypothetical protein BEWA_049280 [Theileria equi strain WA]EKX72461.1 hypothetical protein BEWA_049280 [Theileria equi strain WA]|eukprot:XP_004831913.1 hypothetical protein BEWA_049280 [Theileria equi strain WA]
MVYQKLFLYFLLVQLASVNVPGVSSETSWRRNSQRGTSPRDKINEFNVHRNKDGKLAYFGKSTTKNRLTFKQHFGKAELVSFEITSVAPPFAIKKFVDVNPATKKTVELYGMPINKTIYSMRLYHCAGTLRVLHVSTSDAPYEEWYTRVINSNSFTLVPTMSGLSKDSVDDCKIGKMIYLTGCYKRLCTQDLPLNGRKEAGVKEETSVYPYIKYTFVPNKERALSYNGKLLYYTERPSYMDQPKTSPKPITLYNYEEAAVYYWNDKKGERPIMLELKHSSGESTYYKNLGKDDLTWQAETVRNEEDLEEELDFGNCHLNNAFIVDLTFTNRKVPIQTDFCTRCKLRANAEEKGIKTKETGEIMYYRSFPVEPGFTLTKIMYYDSPSEEKKGVTIPGLDFPTKMVSNLGIYYCKHNPVLLHIKVFDGRQKWYKRSGDVWTHIPSFDNKSPENAEDCATRTQYTSTLQDLGCSFTPGKCTVPVVRTVTADISHKPETRKYVPHGASVEITINEAKAINDFYQITHVSTDNKFTLSTIQHGGTVTNIPPSEKVKELDVYYWKFDEDYSGPLLVKIGRDDKDLWYENTGLSRHRNSEWSLIENPAELYVEDLLVMKLKNINCRINHAYTFDISRDRDYTSFCLDVDVEVSNQVISDLGYTKYTHNTPVIPFTLLGLTNVPQGMSLPDLSEPMRNVSGIYVFKPNSPDKPTLVYLEMADKIHSRWYGNIQEESSAPRGDL